MLLKLKLRFWLFITKALIQPITKGPDMGSSYAEQLLKNVLDRPYNHLVGYMYRYWVIHHPVRLGEGADQEVGTFRNALRYLYPFYARFHHIITPDQDRHPHDHPFDFTSLILAGTYTEEVVMPDGTTQEFVYKAGDVNHKARGIYHRITHVGDRGVITLVIMGRRHAHSWGFLVGDEHVDHKTYLGIESPSVDHPKQVELIPMACAWVSFGTLLALAVMLVFTQP